MGLIQMFNCARGKHMRSRGHAHEEGGAFRSRCKGCGKPMLRTIHGWIVDPHPHQTSDTSDT